MTREIKFRFWDKDNEEMSEVCKLGDDLRWLHSDMHVPLQYTGLKDKNGVEIYEGDIVTSPHGDGTPAVIEWGQVSDDGEHPFSFGWKFGDVLLGSDVTGDYQYTEVIGNIYENPEILT